MPVKNPSPLQTSFWLTKQEKYYILVICALFLLGVLARYFHIKNEKAGTYVPAGVEEREDR